MGNVAYEVQTDAARGSSIPTLDMKFEIVVLPVSDVDRSKEFYARLGGGSMQISITAATFA